ELAHVAEHQRDYKGALGYLAHARDIDAENASVHFFFGIVCMEDNLLQEAYSSLKKAVSLDSGNPYYNLALGLVALQEEPEKAVPAFKKYCEKRPSDPRGHFGLGVAYFYNRSYDLARRELTPLTAHRETAAGAHYFLGRTAQKQDQLSNAERELEEAVSTDPKYADAAAELGQVRLAAGEYKMAEQALRRALEIDQDNYTAHVNLMVLYHRKGDPRAAMEAQRVKEIRKASLERSMERLRRIVIQR
ncbi:MAG: tetratricopeptide repeat protein, partial [Bryobacteraceae bacterium]